MNQPPAAGIEVPADTARSVCLRWPDRGPRWCADAPQELAALCARRAARPVRVIPGRFGFIVAVETRGGRRLVMRSSADPAAPPQARAARSLGSLGIGPLVHEIVPSETGTWTVMDEVIRGEPVTRADVPAVAALLRTLLEERDAGNTLPQLSDWLWPRLDGDPGDDVAPDTRPTAQAEREHALELLRSLRTDESMYLCHGDLWPGNALCGPDGVLLIDPRGTAGDIEYDVGVLALKTEYDVRQLAEQVGVDPARSQTWQQVATAARV